MLVEPDNYWVIRWGDESIEGVAQRRDMYMREGCCRMYSEEEGPKRWHKVVLIVPPEQIPTVRAYVEEQNPQGFYPVQSDAFYLELVPQGISKGRGMKMIQQALGLTKAAAIGDGRTTNRCWSWRIFPLFPKAATPICKKRLILLSIRAKMEL